MIGKHRMAAGLALTLAGLLLGAPPRAQAQGFMAFGGMNGPVGGGFASGVAGSSIYGQPFIANGGGFGYGGYGSAVGFGAGGYGYGAVNPYAYGNGYTYATAANYNNLGGLSAAIGQTTMQTRGPNAVPIRRRRR